MAELEDLRSKREQLLAELSELDGWVLGSLVETERKQGKVKKPFRYLSRSVQGRNRITYVSAAQVPPLREAVERGVLAKRLIEQVADLTVAIIKTENATRKKEG